MSAVAPTAPVRHVAMLGFHDSKDDTEVPCYLSGSRKKWFRLEGKIPLKPIAYIWVCRVDPVTDERYILPGSRVIGLKKGHKVFPLFGVQHGAEFI